MLGMPQPQVRSGSDEGLLLHEGVLRGCERNRPGAGFRTGCIRAENARLQARRKRADRCAEKSDSEREEQAGPEDRCYGRGTKGVGERTFVARECGRTCLEIPNPYGRFREERSIDGANEGCGCRRGAGPSTCSHERRRWFGPGERT